MARNYVQGVYAKTACALIRELGEQGIVAEVGYAAKYSERKRTLNANVRAENAFRVPREFRGFKVVVHIDNELAGAGRGRTLESPLQHRNGDEKDAQFQFHSGSIKT